MISKRSLDPLGALLHVLFFTAAATQTALVPLLPRIDRIFSLSPTASALLLAAPGLATLAVSLPAGQLADRLGAKRVTLVAALMMCAAAFAQAAPAFPALVAGRLVFGIAFGIIWTTGTAWLAHSGGKDRAPHLGAVATSSAVGLAAGPALGGVIADRWGLSAPFLLLGGLSVVLVVLLWPRPAERGRAGAARESLLALARIAPRQPGVVGGAVALAIGGAIGGATQLLVPLQLHGLGFSAASTGAAFSAGAAVYIAISAAVLRLGCRAITIQVSALAALALALSLLPATFEDGPIIVVGALIASTGFRAIVSTVAYPLAARSGGEADLGDGVVIGLLNGVWAAGQVLAPLLAGALDQTGGVSLGYLSVIIPGVGGAIWLLSRRIRGERTTEIAPARA